MFDGYARLLADRFEEHFDLGRLLRREARLPPDENEAVARLPNRNAVDLEDLAVAQSREVSCQILLQKYFGGRLRSFRFADQ
jgi:hypothetical protein